MEAGKQRFRKMRFRKMRFKKDLLCRCAVFILCCLPVLSGCASGEGASTGGKDAVSEKEQGSRQKDDGQGNDGQDQTGAKGSESETLGDFSIQDVAGETYTQDMFADYELTLVNVFTTWCTPCIREIPELEKLHREMADQGVQVAGIVLDAAGQSGETDEEAVKKAKLLAEKAEVTYPFLIPDAGYLNGRLAGISAVPETFFVDKEGNIVGETYSGSRSYDDWKSIVEKELSEAAQ